MSKPSFDALYDTAATQAGYFSTAQAAAAGYSPQLLAKHLANGRVLRARRSVYRLKHFPASDHEELVQAWLWSGRAAVVSHESALLVHGLSQVRPVRVHLTLPLAWSKRRVRVPASVAVHYADLVAAERVRVGPLLATTVSRTLADCPDARVGRSGRGKSKYLCLVCAETLMEGMTERQAAAHLEAYRSFTRRLRARGQLLACNRLLHANTAVTVRVRRGRTKVTDGPFAETKELVGGYFLIEAGDQKEAVRLASRIPGARIGCVEVRPVAEDFATLAALGLAATPSVPPRLKAPFTIK